MTKGDGGNDVMMGDVALVEGEVNPVIPALLSNGLEVTALHYTTTSFFSRALGSFTCTCMVKEKRQIL
jgi:hypothetical protein